MKDSLPRRLWKLIGSLPTTLACLCGLALVVTLCTLAQPRLGIYRAVQVYIDSLFIYAPAGPLKIPILPGGALIGLLLLLNLLAAQIRLERSWRKAGLWIIHLGLILLFAGEFASSLLRREAQLVLRPGQTLSAAQDSQHVELALIDETNPSSDRVYAISEALLQRHGELSPPALPVRLRVHQFDKAMQDDAVAGAQADVEVSDVDPLSASGGRWLLSLGQPGARFLADGRRYRLLLRPRMTPLPLSVTLERFKRQTYPGTDIPRSFSSRVLIRENGRSLERPALISMNDPLRVDGFTFYQSGYDQGGVSILQVVDNPAWSLPYLACALVSLGMLLHFLRRLSLSRAAA